MKIPEVGMHISGVGEHQRWLRYEPEKLDSRMAGIVLSDEFGLVRPIGRPAWWAQICGVADTPTIYEVGSLIFAPDEYRHNWMPRYETVPYLGMFCLGISVEQIVWCARHGVVGRAVAQRAVMQELAFVARRTSFRKWAVNPVVDDLAIPRRHIQLQLQSGRASPENPVPRRNFIESVYSEGLGFRRLAIHNALLRHKDEVFGVIRVHRAPGLHYSALDQVMPDFPKKFKYVDRL